MASTGPTSPLRRVFESQLSQLSVEVERLFEEARQRARRDCADQLNQAVRRLRQASGREEMIATLVDAAALFSAGAALFRIEGQTVKGERICGVLEPAMEAFCRFEIPLTSAAALAGAVESRDPVITATTPSEISSELAVLAGHSPEGRASIFPIVAGERVPALLYTWGAVQGPAIEVLAQVAAAMWPVDTAPVSSLVTIESAPAASAWDRLTVEDQRVHLRAQRMARVEVAAMRLQEPEAVQAGRVHRNLYDLLRPRIDHARETFHQSFFAACPNMVDYLHLEMVRTLAHDDPELLGKDYPGPLV
jgi:hypothetical protein